MRFSVSLSLLFFCIEIHGNTYNWIWNQKRAHFVVRISNILAKSGRQNTRGYQRVKGHWVISDAAVFSMQRKEKSQGEILQFAGRGYNAIPRHSPRVREGLLNLRGGDIFNGQQWEANASAPISHTMYPDDLGMKKPRGSAEGLKKNRATKKPVHPSNKHFLVY